MNKKLILCIYLFFLGFGFFHNLEACTGVMLNTKDGAVVHGRTAEFGIQLYLSTVMIPRGHEFVGTTPQGAGMRYTAKYGCVGAIAFSNLAILDGMNEKGLAVGAFYFPGYANYGTVTKENQAQALSPVEFTNWLVTQFATIEEVKAALKNVVIAPTVIKEWGDTPPPFHYIVYDKSGKCLVIDPLDGKLTTYDNPLGVVTNSPDFAWHMTNLRNYINLRAVNAPPLVIEGLTFTPFSNGSGLLGMPGDFTSPSRFVQATIFQMTSIPSDTAETAVFQTFHILNHFDIPVGSVRMVDAKQNITHNEYTLMTCVRDPQALKYYFKSYEDQTIMVVDLTKFDLNSKQIRSYPIWKDKQSVVNISDRLQVQ